MLPGIRLLFGTFILSASVLIFGLGAAALLRSAHEEFVGVPAWRAAQQPMAPAFDTNRPMLSLARVDPQAPPIVKDDIKPVGGTLEISPAEDKPVEQTKTAALDTQVTTKEVIAEKADAEETPKVQRKPRLRKAKRTRAATGTTIRHWRAPRISTQEQQPLATNSPFAGFGSADQVSSGTSSNRRTATSSPF